MLNFILQRSAQAVVVLLLMSVLVFVAVYAIGNPVDILINPQADQTMRDETIARYGLDKSVAQQYLLFLKNALAGDFGTSFVYDSPALGLIFSCLPATLELALVAMLLSICIGVPLGLYAGYRPDGWSAKLIMGGTVLGFSVPAFWMGLMLILVFAVQLGWLPSGGRGETVAWLGAEWSVLTLDGWRHLLLPASSLALFRLALIVRLVRAGVREAIMADYVKFARAKGVSPLRVMLRHVLPNIMVPLVTVLGLELGTMIAFAVVTETIFSWPGTGKLVIDSIRTLDQPVVVAYLLLVVFMFIVINMVVDILYSMLDPRIRLGGRK
ncbi:ABC transporter permease [Verminephrobacter eiseniae]|uniref:Binding-protein-dependent transport systems inner membrane component n=1 Tax=Verminephrobacter eiseniae (strain EF01-2) TaxID=391735 RepID=A1WPP6_VEREI|nr:ABC transporter permease [Verminephrobacter eiseniae]KAB7591132.1 ABC transporter permease [Verminephrobacter sp. Larva24]ABM59603.1 binding-protein-dependent transport systems inner membrane component [Verminephrobacter eiseniae EF01-2]MCW5231641.1 ABC transporter permease [Verminephrobacter eiseniae]MCW5259928.1 ABC transporter permease [Verminephrobacter eiseniae]MCW5285118.1 ABC transporter permease [Verminephrobacter eiseniae]